MKAYAISVDALMKKMSRLDGSAKDRWGEGKSGQDFFIGKPIKSMNQNLESVHVVLKIEIDVS